MKFHQAFYSNHTYKLLASSILWLFIIIIICGYLRLHFVEILDSEKSHGMVEKRENRKQMLTVIFSFK
jgi:hypothetical protein